MRGCAELRLVVKSNRWGHPVDVVVPCMNTALATSGSAASPGSAQTPG
jgi:hypothetical protein